MLAFKMTQRQFRRIHFSFTMMHFPSERTGHHAPFHAESRVQLQPNPATGVLLVTVRYPEFALCLHFSHTPFLCRRGKTSVPQITSFLPVDSPARNPREKPCLSWSAPSLCTHFIFQEWSQEKETSESVQDDHQDYLPGSLA
jgi:hypothetical protein